jgi:uncharacterized LabA/DUF88 family protein
MNEIAWNTDFDDACRLAKDAGKRVLLDFFSPM